MMKKNFYLVLILFSVITIQAQDYIQKRVTEKNGKPNLIVLDQISPQLKNFDDNQLLNEVLKPAQNSEFKSMKIESFKDGFEDHNFQLYYHNIPVEYGIYKIHYKNSQLISMSGNFYKTENPIINAKINSQSAFQLAVKEIGAKEYLWENPTSATFENYHLPEGKLVFYPVMENDEFKNLELAYKFDIYATKPLSRDLVYVSAVDGKILSKDAIIKHSNHQNFSGSNPEFDKDKNLKQLMAKISGTAETKFSGTKSIETTFNGTNYTLNDQTRGGGIKTLNLQKATDYSLAVDFLDNDNIWSASEYDNAYFDNSALDAHWGIAKTYDYFKNTFNRDSYDNNGSPLVNLVHYSTNYSNAFWTGTQMVYGDGNATYNPFTSLDITAHELAHGVCSSTANLKYERESGAINESLSDIWAMLVEKEYAPEKQNYILGEELGKTTPYYLRSMANPNLKNHPSYYQGTYWYPSTNSCFPHSGNDYCGVHVNSGVLNHWFYILSEGKTVSGLTVSGIGTAKASNIVYRMETSYLSPTSDYPVTREYAIQSAIDLYGKGSPEAVSVQNAFYLVGLGDIYNPNDNTLPLTPQNLIAQDTGHSRTTLIWDELTDYSDFKAWIIYHNDDVVAISTNPYGILDITGLSADTTYNFTVRTRDKNNNLSAKSNLVTVKTLTNQYCNTEASNSNYVGMFRLELSDILNDSYGTSGYEDFTYVVGNVQKSTSYPLYMMRTVSNSTFKTGYSVFVDWNNDGDFNDQNETALTIAPSQTTTVNGILSIPSDAITGKVRMRCIIYYDGVNYSPCGNFDFGQVEDYTLNVTGGTLSVDNIDSRKDFVYPNPTNDYLYYSKDCKKMEVISMDGRILMANSNLSKINLSNLSAGIYMIKVYNSDDSIRTFKIIKE